jgi:sec-independent protein translocase protein TatC
MARGFGLVFQFPILILMLAKFGVVKVATLARARPYVIVGLLVVAAFITPPDMGLSQIALALPSWLLFEAALLIARRFERRAQEEEKAAAVTDDDYGLDVYTREEE